MLNITKSFRNNKRQRNYHSSNCVGWGHSGIAGLRDQVRRVKKMKRGRARKGRESR